MIWLVLFLTVFAILGFVMNYTSLSLVSSMLAPAISIPIGLIGGLILTGRIGHRLANVLPKNESSAVKTNTFNGKIATITTGTAQLGSPAEASFVDDFKQKHYVMVEPISTEWLRPANLATCSWLITA
jgi:hypothetical protein